MTAQQSQMMEEEMLARICPGMMLANVAPLTFFGIVITILVSYGYLVITSNLWLLLPYCSSYFSVSHSDPLWRFH